jgi:hypothetical protein
MLQAYVSGVSVVCCKCFIWMLLKVDLGVAHVAMPIPACCKSIFQVFHLFQTYDANVHLDVSKVHLMLHMVQWSRWLADSVSPRGKCGQQHSYKQYSNDD